MRFLLAIVLATCSIGVERARADIPPPDGCGSVGESCTNAGRLSNEAGTCVESMCTRATPDGTVTYPCGRCVPLAEAAGTPATPAASPASATGSCGASACALSQAPREGALAALLLIAGSAALVWSRRRSG
jgi:hypothetical protein